MKWSIGAFVLVSSFTTFATPAFIQHCESNGKQTTSATATLSAPIAENDLIVVIAVAARGPSPIVLQDDLGRRYAASAPQATSQGGEERMQAFVFRALPPVPTSFTVVVDEPLEWINLVVSEFSGFEGPFSVESAWDTGHSQTKAVQTGPLAVAPQTLVFGAVVFGGVQFDPGDQLTQVSRLDGDYWGYAIAPQSGVFNFTPQLSDSRWVAQLLSISKATPSVDSTASDGGSSTFSNLEAPKESLVDPSLASDPTRYGIAWGCRAQDLPGLLGCFWVFLLIRRRRLPRGRL
jgi:hypothetical protein